MIVDYHQPHRLHPLRWLMRGVFKRLEPYAMDLWDHGLEAFMPRDLRPLSMQKRTYYGGLYQKLVLIR